MKKKIVFPIILLIVIFILMALVLVLTASFKNNTLRTIYRNLSDVRYDVFDTLNDDYYATYISGIREEPYEYDGIKNKMVECGVIEVTIFDTLFAEPELEFCLEVDGENYSGYLERNPFTFTYMSDIEKIFTFKQELTITLKIADCASYVLDCQSKYFAMDWQNACEKVDFALSHKIKELQSTSKNIEFQLKIITNTTNREQPYFWYFCLFTDDHKSISCIIDVKSGVVFVGEI